jgi:DNA modification methylase
MKKYFDDGAITIYHGDALATLAWMPKESVHCCVTSPPYWGLRDYGVPGQLGLEATPEKYVDSMVAVFSEVKRVLRDDGTLWLNVGDSYSASPKGTLRGQEKSTLTSTETQEKSPVGINKLVDGLKPKDLIGIPWMLAFALRADGWYLRSDIIWAKPNGMPESVTDRPTRSHEHLFLLTKSERYFFDAAAIRTPPRAGTVLRLSQPTLDRQVGSNRANGGRKTNGPMKARIPERKKERGHPRPMEGNLDAEPRDHQGLGGANIRDVWWISPATFSEAHFATFPEDLVLPCILAGCPAGGTVLDPFLGSGTTAMVAEANACKAIGIELNEEYIKIALGRVKQKGLEFA